MKPLDKRSLLELEQDLKHVKRMEDVIDTDQAKMPHADFSFPRELLRRGKQELEDAIERKAGEA